MIRKYTDEQEKQVIELYKTGKYSSTALSKHFNTSRCHISRILKQAGFSLIKNGSIFSQKYTLDEHFFDIIDTEEKAYFLGLLYADGSIGDTGESLKLSIGLQERDRDILDKFNFSLKSNRPLFFKKKYNERCQNNFLLTISNSYMCRQLIKLGCIPRKSLTLEFPTSDQVPEDLISHFIRGYFDGDGSLSGFYQNKRVLYPESSIVSTENFCNKVRDIIKQKLDINCFIKKRHKDRDTTTRQLHIGGAFQVVKFLIWMYSNHKISMNRKYNKSIELIELMLSRRLRNYTRDFLEKNKHLLIKINTDQTKISPDQ